MKDGKCYRTPDRPGRARRTHLEVRLSVATTCAVFTKTIADSQCGAKAHTTPALMKAVPGTLGQSVAIRDILRRPSCYIAILQLPEKVAEILRCKRIQYVGNQHANECRLVMTGGFALFPVRQRVAAHYSTATVMGKSKRCVDRSAGTISCISWFRNTRAEHRVCTFVGRSCCTLLLYCNGKCLVLNGIQQ